jgi:hypothetical protein
MGPRKRERRQAQPPASAASPGILGSPASATAFPFAASPQSLAAAVRMAWGAGSRRSLQPERQASLMQLPCEFLAFFKSLASLPSLASLSCCALQQCLRKCFVIDSHVTPTCGLHLSCLVLPASVTCIRPGGQKSSVGCVQTLTHPVAPPLPLLHLRLTVL